MPNGFGLSTPFRKSGYVFLDMIYMIYMIHPLHLLNPVKKGFPSFSNMSLFAKTCTHFDARTCSNGIDIHGLKQIQPTRRRLCLSFFNGAE